MKNTLPFGSITCCIVVAVNLVVNKLSMLSKKFTLSSGEDIVSPKNKKKMALKAHLLTPSKRYFEN